MIILPLGLSAALAVAVAVYLRISFPTNVVPAHDSAAFARSVHNTILGFFVVGASALVNGSALGTDLERGYYRVWFSAPISPPWYYLLRFIIAGSTILCFPFMLGVGLASGLGASTGITIEGIEFVVLAYILAGSVTLLLSHVSSRDWILVILIAILQGRLAALDQSTMQRTAWLRTMSRLLPPFQLLHPDRKLTAVSIAYVGCYAAAALAISLAILRSRELATGSRS